MHMWGGGGETLINNGIYVDLLWEKRPFHVSVSCSKKKQSIHAYVRTHVDIKLLLQPLVSSSSSTFGARGVSDFSGDEV